MEAAHKASSAALTAQLAAAQAEAASLRQQVAVRSGDANELSFMSAEHLSHLAMSLEAALARVREAQARDRCCPVCWEQPKQVVFGCGHQACKACGDKLRNCPICRHMITLRIKVF
eukprot:GHRR01030524.1.p3 GENE.GHRR01030524.1~~GHRR01030524.1.p3  ORF type:complete len:116 (+),score=38.08 GHRR01030524.1:304-651(+)